MARVSESSFLSSDGKTNLYCRLYLPDSEPVGIVQIVHGIAEHIGRYDHFASYLADNGYIVAAHDQLGHGKSAQNTESLGFLDEKDGWNKAVLDIRSLHDATIAKHPGKPYFLFGHSMGSFLVRTYLIRFRAGLDGAIFSGTGQMSSPMIAGSRVVSSLEMRRKGGRYKSTSLNKIAFGSYNSKVETVRTSYDWLSRDEAVVDEFIEDPQTGFIPTVELFHEMMGGYDFITKPKNVARMKKDLPILFISGDKDPVGDFGRGVIRAYKSFLKAGMTDVTMKLYHGGRHEMLNEINSDEVYQDILFWLNSKVGF